MAFIGVFIMMFPFLAAFVGVILFVFFCIGMLVFATGVVGAINTSMYKKALCQPMMNQQMMAMDMDTPSQAWNIVTIVFGLIFSVYPIISFVVGIIFA